MVKQRHNTESVSEMHFHDAHEVLFVQGGKYRINAPHNIYEGEGPCIVVFRLGVYHGVARLECEKNPFVAYFMNCRQGMIDEIPKHIFAPQTVLDKDVLVIPVDEMTMDFFVPLCEELVKITKGYKENEPLPTEAYGYFFVIMNKIKNLVLGGEALSFAAETGADYYISKVIKTVIESIQNGQDVSVASLAEQFFVSRSKLSKDFHHATGITVKGMINELRLERVRKMLREGRENKEIVERCGFSSESYFVQFFNKHMNMSPGAYRQAELEAIGEKKPSVRKKN